MATLKEVLAAKIPAERQRAQAFVKEHGATVIVQVNVEQVYGGMRGISCLLCDTSSVPADKGLIVRGKPIADVANLLPEEIFWLLLTGELPDAAGLASLQADLAKRSAVPDYVWVFLISGSAPPAHFNGGWAGASSERQPYMYFRLGGGTLKGISKPGEIVWSRVYVEDGRLKMDLGRAGVVTLPAEETNRRWQATTPQWPIMHAVTYGVTRDQMMARHKSNHIQVAYANSAEEADKALLAKAAMAQAMGLKVAICGGRKNGEAWA